MTSHDVGRHLGCYGVETVRSPNLDQLAAEGLRFDNCFCTAPQCSPARASLFTGRYPHCNGMMGLAHGQATWDIGPGERHMAGFLREAGWHTALVHHQHETRRPGEMGYDEIIGLDRRRPCNEVAELVDGFLASRRGADRPFFCQVGFFEPHRSFTIWDSPPDDALGVTIPPHIANEPSAVQEFAEFQGAIHKLDAAVGRILQSLDEHGAAENTLVIFTADHGIPFPRAKCSLYDPGLVVTLLMRWPGGGWGSGKVLTQMVSHLDVLPTLLELGEIDRPDNLHGQSLFSLLSGESAELRDAVFGQMTYHDYCDPRRCIRTANHKLIVNFTFAPSFMDPSQSWRPNTVTSHPPQPEYDYHTAVELYDLVADPQETQNLAQSPQHRSICRMLLMRLHDWMSDTHDPLLSGIPPSPMFDRAMGALTTGYVPPEPDR